MNIKELEEELKKNNINQKSCLINPKICPEGALCLKKEENDLWTVTLNERGEFRIKEEFYNEHDACRFFLFNVISDPTDRNDFEQKDLFDFQKNKTKFLKKYGF